MIVLILAAGYGTRLYPLTQDTPKALLPVNGRPILSFILNKIQHLSAHVKELLLVSNHRYAQSFREWMDRSELNLPYRVLDDGSTSEQDRLGSVGDLAFAVRSCAAHDDLLVIGSDNLFEDDLTSFFLFAQDRMPAVTLGAYELPERSLACRYGVLTVDDNGRVSNFSEKPSNPSSPMVSTAVYFFPRAALDLVLEYSGSSASTDTLGSFIHWLIARQPVFAYRFRGLWFDIGDRASYAQAKRTFPGRMSNG